MTEPIDPDQGSSPGPSPFAFDGDPEVGRTPELRRQEAVYDGWRHESAEPDADPDPAADGDFDEGAPSGPSPFAYDDAAAIGETPRIKEEREAYDAAQRAPRNHRNQAVGGSSGTVDGA